MARFLSLSPVVPYVGVTQFLHLSPGEGIAPCTAAHFVRVWEEGIQEPALSPSRSRMVNKCFSTKGAVLGRGVGIWTGR